MHFKSMHELISAVEAGVIPPVTLETAYRRLHALFGTPLPNGPIMRDGHHILDKKSLLYYLLVEFDDRSVLSVVRYAMDLKTALVPPKGGDA